MAVRGRPFQPGNKFGKGRPRGSRNKTTQAALALLDSYAEPVTRKAILTALQGEPTILRVVLDRIVPVRREVGVKLGALPMATTADLLKASEAVFRKTASGDLTLTEAKGFADLIEGRRKVIETHELAQRVEALEARV